MRALGAASDIGDQPPLRLLCATVTVAGALRGDGRLTKTGIRMLAAHTLATWGKGRIKAVIDRTRPNSEQRGYAVGPGTSHAHEDNSFPSGHSAGIVAVAEAFARSYPDHAIASRAAAGAVAVMQVARGEHFIGDALVGSLIGVAAERACNAAHIPPALEQDRGNASIEVPPSAAAALRTPPRPQPNRRDAQPPPR